ncbi:PHP domain-containing protein [Rheinheimera fenheensis]|uniref:PHP domain-containing protein n=1 Tax=Rheinheimera fenheensis TaxID=3152295 RepID=UPI00325FE07F
MANTKSQSNTPRRLPAGLKPLLLLGALLVVLWWLLTSSGQISSSNISSKDVTTARKLLSSTLRQLSHADDRIELRFEQAQLDALMNVASYTLVPVQFSGVISNFGVAVRADWQVLAQRKVSAYCLLLPGNEGFAIDHCRLGKIPLPGVVANALLSAAVKTMLAAPADEQLLSLLQKGELANGKLYFVDENASALKLKLNPQLYQARNMARDLLQSDSRFAPDIAVYLQQLRSLYQQHPDERRLAFYSRELLLFAATRAAGDNPEYEYRQAMWALAVGFGNRHFVRYATDNVEPGQVPRLAKVTLLGRHDLALHFLYSAIFQQLGSAGISSQIGNLKEILDADSGGSGFSFADLSADRAGILFAERLSRIDANRLAQFDSDEMEMAMMPAVHDLPEGLTEQQVIEQLGGYQGAGFKALEQEIAIRLDQLALYQQAASFSGVAQLSSANGAPPSRTLIADLHLHSRYSDGARSIDELAHMAQQHGCDVIALTDHSDRGLTRFDTGRYQQDILSARARHAPLNIITGLEWNVLPFRGREHVGVLLPDLDHTAELLQQFRQQFDSGSTTPFNAQQGLSWLNSQPGLNQQQAVLFYNHPSRKDLSAGENLFDVKLWRSQYSNLVGFEGGPGHQRQQGNKNASYTYRYRTVDGWDPAVAVIGGQWDKLLQQGMDIWGALASSDYHNDSLDYAPCQFSRTHIHASVNTTTAVLDALRQGQFWGSQGNTINSLQFYADTAMGERAYAGQRVNTAATRVTVTLALRLNPTDWQGLAVGMPQAELIMITPDAITSHSITPKRQADGSFTLQYQVKHQDNTVLRLRGYTENPQGQRYYFYTNPLRFTR